MKTETPGQILSRVRRAAAIVVTTVVTACGPVTSGRPATTGATNIPAADEPATPPPSARAGIVADAHPTEADADAPIGLTLLDVVVLPTNIAGAGSATGFGSLSGLARDPRSGRYLAVIDDRQPSRVAWVDITFDGSLRVTPGTVHATTAADGVDRRQVERADLEGVVSLPDGSFVATDEGYRATGARGRTAPGIWPAALLSISPSLVVTHISPWPAMFDLGDGAGGIRDNQGAEALAITPDGRLIAGIERPLYRDMDAPMRNGRPYSDGRAGPGRLVEFVRDGAGWRAARQWLYPIGDTPLRPGFGTICDDGELGLTDLIALGDTRLISLERACLIDPATRVVRNVILLHEVDIAGADDVSGVTTRLDPAVVRPVRKRLILDMDTLIPQLPASIANLDNFEALAFGPELPDGRRTLLVVSDDNFRPTQKTVVLLFAIAGTS
ncbi:MAG: esterase-like activity of phytase family protein [Acidobacteria bacterium]|nr:esterase-like activity of phytase family protein [Acidobacteriota bacterium]